MKPCWWNEITNNWTWIINVQIYFLCFLCLDLGAPFFPGGPELWHHPLAYSATADMPGSAALQHATLMHPGLHPQMPVRSYLWLNSDKSYEQVSTLYNNCRLSTDWRVSHHQKFIFDLCFRSIFNLALPRHRENWFRQAESICLLLPTLLYVEWLLTLTYHQVTSCDA